MAPDRRARPSHATPRHPPFRAFPAVALRFHTSELDKRTLLNTGGFEFVSGGYALVGLPSILFADQRRRVSAQSAVRGLAMFVPHWQMVDRCVHVAVLERALDSVPVPEIARVTRVHDLVSLHALEATPQMLAASAHDRLPRRSSSLNARLHVSRRASLRLRAS